MNPTQRARNRRMRTIVASMMIAALGLTSAKTARADNDAKRSGAQWVREGNRLLEAKDYGKALDAYDKAQQLLPESAKVSYNRGIALYELGRYDEAETALQNALRPDALPLEADAKYNLGRCAQAAAMSTKGDANAALNQTKRAVEFYKDALELRPDDRDTKKNLSIAEHQQKYLEKLIELARKQQQQNPQQQQQKQDDQNKQDEQKQDSQDQQQGGGTQDQQQQSGSKSNKDEKQDQQQQGKPSENEQQSEQEQQRGQESEQKESQSSQQEGEQGQQDSRSDQKLGDDQLKERQAQQENATESGDEQQERKNEVEAAEEEQQAKMMSAASQPATTMPAESPLEMEKRISVDKANRLLQQARDKEARRREALREARLRSMGRARVEKDW